MRDTQITQTCLIDFDRLREEIFVNFRKRFSTLIVARRPPSGGSEITRTDTRKRSTDEYSC